MCILEGGDTSVSRRTEQTVQTVSLSPYVQPVVQEFSSYLIYLLCSW